MSVIESAGEGRGVGIDPCHRLFLFTDWVIYLLSFDLTKLEELDDVHNWLNILGAYAPGSPLIICGTNKEDRMCSAGYVTSVFNQIRNKARCPAEMELVRRCCAVSLKTERGMDDVVSSIIDLTAAHPEMPLQVSVPFLYLEAKMKAFRHASQHTFSTVNLSSFERIAGDVDVVETADAAKFLHKLGIIRYVAEVDDDMIVLDPQWILNMYACLVKSKDTVVSAGILLEQHASLVWCPPEFPTKFLPFIKHTLISAGLIYAIDSVHPVYLRRMGMGDEDGKGGETPLVTKPQIELAIQFSPRKTFISPASPSSAPMASPRNSAPPSSLPSSFGSSPSSPRSPRTSPPSPRHPRISLTSSTSSTSPSPSPPPISEQKENEGGKAVKGYLIPSLLDLHRPKKAILPKTQSLRRVMSRMGGGTGGRAGGEVGKYGRDYLLEYLPPPTFFPTLMIQFMQIPGWSPDAHWLSGILITCNEDKTKVLLQTESGTQIKLRLDGDENSSSHFSAMTENMDVLFTEKLKIPMTVKVPCSHCLLLDDPKPYSFSLRECQVAVAAGKEYLTCRKGGKIHEVLTCSLVPDLSLRTVRGEGIRFQDIELLEEIGEGAFAKVYRAIWKGEYVAVKKLVLPSMASLEDDTEDGDPPEEEGNDQMLSIFDEFRREVSMFSTLQHSRIVDLKGFVMEPFCIVLEYMQFGTLYEYIYNKENSLDWDFRVHFATDIALGMEFLHKNHLIHRDIKSPNILLTEERTGIGRRLIAKVADFGLSRKLLLSPDLQERVVDNPTWLAPEILESKPYTEKVDVYSFAVILWEMLVRTKPYEEFEFMWEIQEMVLNGDRPPIPVFCYGQYQKLLVDCWDQHPSKRPSFTDILARLNEVMMEVCNEGLIQQESPRVRIDAIEESPAEAKDKGSVKSGKVTKPVLLMRRPSISMSTRNMDKIGRQTTVGNIKENVKVVVPAPRETRKESQEKRLSRTKSMFGMKKNHEIAKSALMMKYEEEGEGEEEGGGVSFNLLDGKSREERRFRARTMSSGKMKDKDVIHPRRGSGGESPRTKKERRCAFAGGPQPGKEGGKE